MSIALYIQGRNRSFTPHQTGWVAFASSFAKSAGSRLTLITQGLPPDKAAQLGGFGADEVMVVDGMPPVSDLHNSIEALFPLFKEKGETFILFGNDTHSKALAALIAARLEFGIVTGVGALPESFSPLVLNRKAFSGKVITSTLVGKPGVVVVFNAGVGEAVAGISSPVITELHLNGNSDEGIVVESEETGDGKQLLTDALRVVSGGRGMKGPENWKPLEELASVLGAALACSRPVSDEGWRSHHEHVGQTGKVIAPELYVACGISGAIQHVAGINGSKVIVAINKDKEAPIFEVADYGIVGDVNTVLPSLIKALKE